MAKGEQNCNKFVIFFRLIFGLIYATINIEFTRKGAIDINFLKKSAAVFAACLMLIAAAGCGKKDDDGCDYSYTYDISSNPVTLDPQQADEPNSDLIIENVFMGLLTLGKDGSVKEGAASDFVVSEDGLTYDFKLRQDIYWIDNDEFERQCTAKDFVFGFTRLFLPETRSSRAEDYYCIKNSKLLHTGKITDSSMLGVKAKGDFELEITLEYPNARFLTMLTEPPAMPCNEEFFLNSQGKYGLSAECTPSNGAFYVRRWLYDPYSDLDSNNIILNRNTKNAEAREICPSSVSIYIDDEEEFINNLLEGDISCLAVSNDDRALIKGDFGCEEFCSITCGLTFNRQSELFKNSDFCKALSLLVDRETIMSAIPEFKAAEGLVPEQVSMIDKSYRELIGGCKLSDYDANAAQGLFKKAKPSLDLSRFTGTKIIVQDSAAETAVSYIMQEWQREFGFYCVVENLPENEFRDRLNSGDYDIAVMELSGKYNSPSAYLEQFSSSAADNRTGFSDSGFDALLKQAEEAADLSDSAELYKKAEQVLVDKAAFVPLYYKNEYFFTVEGGTDIVYNPFSKTVDFRLAKLFD